MCCGVSGLSNGLLLRCPLLKPLAHCCCAPRLLRQPRVTSHRYVPKHSCVSPVTPHATPVTIARHLNHCCYGPRLLMQPPSTFHQYTPNRSCIFRVTPHVTPVTIGRPLAHCCCRPCLIRQLPVTSDLYAVISLSCNTSCNTRDNHGAPRPLLLRPLSNQATATDIPTVCTQAYSDMSPL